MQAVTDSTTETVVWSEEFEQYIPGASLKFQQVWRAPLFHTFSCGIPNAAALSTIAKYAPILELGSGSGYWAALLQQAGVDVIAMDGRPPPLESGEPSHNKFFKRAFTVDPHPDHSLSP